MIQEEICYWGICFVRAEVGSLPDIFGFGEYITALALIVVLYTIADTRYRFRVSTMPGPFLGIAYGIIIVTGLASLLSEVWFAEGWWLPKTAYLTGAIWQAIIASLFLVLLSNWIYYAFIRPPIFGKRNCKRYTRELYRIILEGDEEKLKVVASELLNSAEAIVGYSSHLDMAEKIKSNSQSWFRVSKNDIASAYANDILRLIANRKLCRHIVGSSSATALAFFRAMSDKHKYNIPIGLFSKMISQEAIANKDSILYHEDGGFSSGLIGKLKTWSKALYGNSVLVGGLSFKFNSPFDVDFQEISTWDGRQWDAYCRALMLYIEDLIARGKLGNCPPPLIRAIGNLEHATREIYKLDNQEAMASSDEYEKLRVIVRFMKGTINAIDEAGGIVPTRPHRGEGIHHKGIHDHLADSMFEILLHASSVKAPFFTAWTIQHNSTWSEFFGLWSKSDTWAIVQFKLRRLLYNEVKGMVDMPNFKGAAILGLLLNVTGVKESKKHDRDSWPVAKAAVLWTKYNYLSLREKLPDVADRVLMGSITFDADSGCIVKTYAKGLSKEAPYDSLKLEPVSK